MTDQLGSALCQYVCLIPNVLHSFFSGALGILLTAYLAWKLSANDLQSLEQIPREVTHYRL
jgi:hypothetical protein